MGEQESKGLQSLKQTLILELEKRVKDKILENENKELLAKLISNADSITEAQAIMALGTTYKRTGFHFDKRLEKSSDKIFYFKKNEELSFSCDFWNKQGEGVKGEAEAVEMRNCGFQARNKGVTKAVMTEVEGEESTIYRSKQAKGEVSLVNATPLKHTLIIGDNYPALQNLLITYKEKVKVIYIDPPYGKDDLGEFAKTNYHNAITRDNLLSMLYPRLQLAKELLKDDGVIFCSIDDKNQAYVKCLFDEVFGEGNFVADFIRKTKSTTNDAKTGVNYQHEFLLCYAKNKENVNLLGGEKDLSKYTNPDNDPNGAWVSSDPTAKSGDMKTGYFAVKNPYTGKEDYPTNGRFWRFSQNTLQKHIDEGHICFKEEHKENERGFIYKRYLKELKTNLRTFDSLKFVENAFMNQVATKELLDLNLAEVFTYPKGVDFIKEILRHSTTPNTQTQATKEQFTPPPPPRSLAA